MNDEKNYDGQGKSREEDAMGAMRAIVILIGVCLALPIVAFAYLLLTILT